MNYTHKALFIASSMFCFSLSVFSRPITLQSDNISVKAAMEYLQNNSDYSFVYSTKDVDTNKRISISSKNEQADEVVRKILESQKDIDYKIEGNTIIIKKTEKSEQQNSRTITGIVKDKKGEAIIGANVVVKGTTNGVITDFDGKFSLKVSEGDILVVSYIGYSNIEVAVDRKKDFVIVLKDNVEFLDEVVVIGYGSVRQSDLSGAVSTLKSKDFENQKVNNSLDVLQGRMSGVQVQNTSGELGATPHIRIRGANSINGGNEPLYVIDGIPGNMNDVIPADIQSIEVLKDASAAAIYGSRGANGVVIVTTKKGRQGEQNFSVNVDLSLSTLPRWYDNVMTPYEYAVALNDVKGQEFFDDEQLRLYKEGNNPNTVDFKDEALRTAFSQNVVLNYSGGTSRTNYYVSGRFLNEEGLSKENSRREYNLHGKFHSELTSWAEADFDVKLKRSESRGRAVNLLDMMAYSPTIALYDENGEYNVDPYNSQKANPLANQFLKEKESTRHGADATFELKLKPLEGLTLSNMFRYNYGSSFGANFQPDFMLGNGSSAGVGKGDNYGYTNVTNLTYDKQFGKHHLTATGVYEASYSSGNSVDLEASNLYKPSFKYHNMDLAGTKTSNYSFKEHSMMSYLGRFMYNYDHKYFFTVSFRRDGSSHFLKNKWGNFPSAALSWDIAKEPFMQKINAINQFKIRTSYGITGSQALDTYDTLGTLRLSQYSYGTPNPFTGYAYEKLSATNLTWEKTKQFDIGLDISLFNNLLTFNFDFFHKHTYDLLLKNSIPYYLGAANAADEDNEGSRYWENRGAVNNTGVEFSIGVNCEITKDFTYNGLFTNTFVKNTVKDLGEVDEIFDTADYYGMNILRVGEPMSAIYGYEFAGLDENGCNTFVDHDGDGEFSIGDRTILGQGTPKYTFGFNNTFTYKDISLNLFINGAFGALRGNWTRYQMQSMEGYSRFIMDQDYYENNFDKIGQKSKYQTLKGQNINNQLASDLFIENANFVKLKNISLSYLLRKDKTKFADILFTLACQNVFTITGYSGLDPEVVENSNDTNTGRDKGRIPSPRSYSFSVKLNF